MGVLAGHGHNMPAFNFNFSGITVGGWSGGLPNVSRGADS